MSATVLVRDATVKTPPVRLGANLEAAPQLFTAV